MTAFFAVVSKSFALQYGRTAEWLATLLAEDSRTGIHGMITVIRFSFRPLASLRNRYAALPQRDFAAVLTRPDMHRVYPDGLGWTSTVKPPDPPLGVLENVRVGELR